MHLGTTYEKNLLDSQSPDIQLGKNLMDKKRTGKGNNVRESLGGETARKNQQYCIKNGIEAKG